MQLSFSLPCMEESGHELCFLSSPNYDRRVGCSINGDIYVSQNWKGWEVWRFIKDESSGHFIITSWTHDKKVLCSGPDGRVFTTENKEGSWGKWRIVPHPKFEGLRIESVEHDRFLSLSGQDLYTMKKKKTLLGASNQRTAITSLYLRRLMTRGYQAAMNTLSLQRTASLGRSGLLNQRMRKLDNIPSVRWSMASILVRNRMLRSS